MPAALEDVVEQLTDESGAAHRAALDTLALREPAFRQLVCGRSALARLLH